MHRGWIAQQRIRYENREKSLSENDTVTFFFHDLFRARDSWSFMRGGGLTLPLAVCCILNLSVLSLLSLLIRRDSGTKGVHEWVSSRISYHPYNHTPSPPPCQLLGLCSSPDESPVTARSHDPRHLRVAGTKRLACLPWGVGDGLFPRVTG